MYKERTSGKCTDDSGGGYITNLTACNAGATALGWGDTTADNDGQSRVNSKPLGCYYEQNFLKFNNDRNTGSCSSPNDICACTITCQVGTYQDQTEQTTCKSCEVGLYQDQVGQSSCKSCETGLYQDQTGRSSCKSCGAGSYQDQAGQSSDDSCKACVVGLYQDQTGRASLTCADTTFSVTIGSSSANSKTVTVTQQGSITCPTVVDRNNWLSGETYGDTFAITVAGNQIKAQQ